MSASLRAKWVAESLGGDDWLRPGRLSELGMLRQRYEIGGRISPDDLPLGRLGAPE
jgi:hypothetical protein